ncbi:MAG: hypothetical protein H7288_13530 [Kineosporiaceae bacterium]|nr:hypothetical protein [Aeromicrobium sp.]
MQQTQRADAAHLRIFEATCEDPEWLARARLQVNKAHCHAPANSEQRWAAVHALEDTARDAEQSYGPQNLCAQPTKMPSQPVKLAH